MLQDYATISPKDRAQIESKVKEIIVDRIGKDVKDVRFDWSSYCEDRPQVEIIVEINKASDPKTWRGGFAGLTRRVQEAMPQLRSVFPILEAQAA